VNAPVAEVVWAVQVWVAIVPPAMDIEPIVVLTENPEPVTVTLVPTGPEVGLRLIEGVVTVKVADAVFALASVAVTVLAPAEEAGTTNVAEKAPVADVVTVTGTVVCVAPLNFIVMVEVEAKPAPVTVTVVPTGPEVGFRVIDGVTVKVVTVKIAEAVFALASVAVTVLAPAEEAGTTNVAEKAPVADVVTVTGTVVCVAPLNFIVMVEVEAKPAPVTVTVVPTGPEVGFRVIDGVTVKVAVALSAGTVPTLLPETVTV
jgi:hypothetical protein